MIKADGSANVKVRVLSLLAVCSACFGASHPLFAQVSEKEVQNLEAQEFGIESGRQQRIQKLGNPQNATPPEDYQPEAEPEKVRSIEAEEFRVRMLRKSRSGRVLMFEDATDNRPRPGKILLIKKDNDDIAAVRVLKNYAGRFAAKVVLPINELRAGAEYRAIKKLGDKVIALIREREKRGKDLDAAKTDEDLAREVSPDDNELDRGIPIPKPRTTKKISSKPEGPPGPGSPAKPEPLFTPDGQEIGTPEMIEVKDEDEPFVDMSVQEDLPLDPYRHALSLQYGSMRSVDKDAQPASYGAIGLRYAFNAWKMPLWRRRTFQDMFSLELGLFYYTISGFLKTEDNVTVMPIIGTVRYSLLIGENLSLFTYLGFIRNNVSQGDASENEVSSNTAVLATTKAAVGLGATIKIGPAWAFRLDVGTDLFGIGAVLKF